MPFSTSVLTFFLLLIAVPFEIFAAPLPHHSKALHPRHPKSAENVRLHLMPLFPPSSSHIRFLANSPCTEAGHGDITHPQPDGSRVLSNPLLSLASPHVYKDILTFELTMYIGSCIIDHAEHILDSNYDLFLGGDDECPLWQQP